MNLIHGLMCPALVDTPVLDSFNTIANELATAVEENDQTCEKVALMFMSEIRSCLPMLGSLTALLNQKVR